VLSTHQIAQLCDHTFLLPTEAFRQTAKAGENPIFLRRWALDSFLDDAISSPLKPYAICVNASDVSYVVNQTAYVLAATVGFPDGPRRSLASVAAETDIALKEGAAEIDMVMDYDALIAGNIDKVEYQLSAVAEVVSRHNGLLKVILETSELTLDQTALACVLAERSGAAFVKTSTGFSAKGATIDHVKVMRDTFPRGIKISGGITLDNVNSFLEAAGSSADPLQLRIGESSLLQQLVEATP
jgi:deoxyribose-phosphate aldolase